jgi:hypothetical protein
MVRGDKLSVVIPEAAKWLSGIHTPQQWSWIPGSRAGARAPE